MGVALAPVALQVGRLAIGGTLPNWYYSQRLINWTHRECQLERRELELSTRSVHLSRRAVPMGVINAWREDLRDLFSVKMQMLDNYLLVTTLLFSVGFSVVLEGTFPPPEAVRKDEGWLCVYAALCGLALVCPFLGLLCIIRCKALLERSFQEKVFKINKLVTHMLRDISREVANTQASWKAEEDQSCGSSSHEGRPQPTMTSRVHSETFSKIDKKMQESLKMLFNEDCKRDSWDDRCEFLYKIAVMFAWTSMLACMAVCILLMVLIVKLRYRPANAPWRSYLTTLVVAITCGFCIGGWVCQPPRKRAAPDQSMNSSCYSAPSVAQVSERLRNEDSGAATDMPVQSLSAPALLRQVSMASCNSDIDDGTPYPVKAQSDLQASASCNYKQPFPISDSVATKACCHRP